MTAKRGTTLASESTSHEVLALVRQAQRGKFAPHDVVGPYRLASQVAISRTYEVWEAVDDRSDKRRALKILVDNARGNRRQIAALRREHAVGSRLHHEAVIRTDDFGVDDGIAYLAMELYAHPNLKQRMHQDSGQLESLLASILEQSCQALAFVHGQGWIHRDIKPGNFLIDDEGNVKLIDFSLAWKIRPWWVPQFLGMSIEGTRTYMPPEQIRRKRQDERSDIYSFGCVIFELLCGKPPFTGESSDELLTKHLRSPPPSPRTHNPRVSKRFGNLVCRMLAKSRRERPQTMQAILHQINHVNVFDG